jgi:uracil-DNA glycosylase family protein
VATFSSMPRRPTPAPAATAPSAAPFVPPRPTLGRLREAAAGCRGCQLWERATQTVFGEGARDADLVFVGEQPGDREDFEGHPFIGPAGRLLEAAIAEAGLDRRRVYLTNAVKHFKWEPRGKRRIHQKPNGAEVSACRPWLDAELSAIRPRAVVCLGATAAQALLGMAFKVTQHRGEVQPTALAPLVMATVHPSSILRAIDDAERHAERARFVEDLRALRRALERAGAGAHGEAAPPPA